MMAAQGTGNERGGVLVGTGEEVAGSNLGYELKKIFLGEA